MSVGVPKDGWGCLGESVTKDAKLFAEVVVLPVGLFGGKDLALLSAGISNEFLPLGSWDDGWDVRGFRGRLGCGGVEVLESQGSEGLA